jgi:hypothetical protein
MMPSPIQDAAARYRATRARVLADAAQAAEAIRRDLGQPRDRRKWQDHPGLWNGLRTDVVNRLNTERQRALNDLAAAKAEARRWLYRVPVDHAAGLNRTMAEVSYRQAREFASSIPLGEVGVSIAMTKMRMAALVGDEAEMAALTLLAEERGGGGGTVWDRVPALWAEATTSKHTRERLGELREVEVAMRQLADPERYDIGRLTPLAPEPEPPPSLEPAPTLAGGNGQTGGSSGEPPALG